MVKGHKARPGCRSPQNSVNSVRLTQLRTLNTSTLTSECQLPPSPIHLPPESKQSHRRVFLTHLCCLQNNTLLTPSSSSPLKCSQKRPQFQPFPILPSSFYELVEGHKGADWNELTSSLCGSSFQNLQHLLTPPPIYFGTKSFSSFSLYK